MTSPPSTDLVYVRRSTCQGHMQPLNQQLGPDAPLRVLKVGQKLDCPDCGRTWYTVQRIAWGGVVLVEWQCYRSPGVPDPMVAVLARLDALEATTATQAATIATLNATVATMNNTIAALVSRTVTSRLGRTAMSAVTLGVGKTADVAVTWSSPLADASYTVDVAPPTALAGKVTWAVKAGTKTAAGVTITLTATTALTLTVGSDLVATATRYA